MKQIKCDECGEVIIVLEKGSKVKPNIYAMHESCPVSREKSTNGAEEYERQMKSKESIKEMFGGIF
jgi:hypothetical protein